MEDLNNNDPLEELFKSKAEEYDITYREEDWRTLEKRLDAAKAQPLFPAKWWLTAAAVLLLFSVLGYFTYQNYQRINSLDKQLGQTQQTTNAPSQSSGDQFPAGPSNNAQNKKQDNPKGIIDDNDIDTNTTAEDLENNSANNQNKQFTSNQSIIRKSSVEHLAVAKLNCNDCGYTDLNSTASAKTSSFSVSEASSVEFQTIAAESLQEKPDEHSPKSIFSGSRSDQVKTSLGFVFGPDLSTVGSMANFYNPGYKIGITADFSISPNLALSIGAIRSDVRYKAIGLQYQFSSQQYGSNSVRTNQTVGKCILIDIPIELSYRIIDFEHSRLYASAGISSYIMLNEEYKFDFNTNQQGYPERWQGNTGNTHLFSNASLSVGYEFDLNRNISLRAEPFLRIPLREVGHANVNLYSVGSLVSINYNLF